MTKSSLALTKQAGSLLRESEASLLRESEATLQRNAFEFRNRNRSLVDNWRDNIINNQNPREITDTDQTMTNLRIEQVTINDYMARISGAYNMFMDHESVTSEMRNFNFSRAESLTIPTTHFALTAQNFSQVGPDIAAERQSICARQTVFNNDFRWGRTSVNGYIGTLSHVFLGQAERNYGRALTYLGDPANQANPNRHSLAPWLAYARLDRVMAEFLRDRLSAGDWRLGIEGRLPDLLRHGR